MERAKDKPGEFTVVVPDVPNEADYVFMLDDGRELPDPASRWLPHGVHGASRIVDPAYAWTDTAWRGLPMEELVIYELHVGTFTPEGTFAAVVPRLAALKALGITAIELMPVAQFSGGRNWGYDGVGLYAVQHEYGGPAELRKLVDAAHAHGLAVILDVVYNHVGPEGNYLDAFGPYFTEKYKTPWGPALNYDDADSDGVRAFIVDNARYWVTEYHVDGLRLDAVHGIIDFSALHLIEEIAGAVHSLADSLGRTVVVIGESDLNDPRLIRPAQEFGYGLDGQWSDDFHHAVHATLTTERTGYYADFGDVHDVADTLREPFLYDGAYSAHRRRRHGRSSRGLPRKQFVVAVQNHDQVGNRAVGERLAALLAPAQLRVAAALLLLSPYVPLLFMGEEYGETNPFQYFISHSDDELVESVRAGRKRDFEGFGWGDGVPDPAAEDTFRRSTLDWAKAAQGGPAQLRALYRDLLALRRDEPMLRPDGSIISVADGEPGWITLLREPAAKAGAEAADAGQRFLAIFNCSAGSVEVPVPGSTARAWTVRLSTDAAGYGGTGGGPLSIDASTESERPRRIAEATRSVRMSAWSAALFAAEDAVV
jgi:maltooligosyltrehalose trehalohydrolase